MSLPATWRVGIFWSSSAPKEQVRCLAQGDEIQEYEQREDFISWEANPDLDMLKTVSEELETSSWECPRCDYPEDLKTLDVAYMLRDYLTPPRALEPCLIPPAGWACTRGKGHPGPCAAVPVAPAAQGSMIEVNAEALKQVLVALNGDGHLVRELQATRNPLLGDNPINTLIDAYKAWALARVEAQLAAPEVKP
jgi:hypothetical protein